MLVIVLLLNAIVSTLVAAYRRLIEKRIDFLLSVREVEHDRSNPDYGNPTRDA